MTLLFTPAPRQHYRYGCCAASIYLPVVGDHYRRAVVCAIQRAFIGAAKNVYRYLGGILQ